MYDSISEFGVTIAVFRRRVIVLCVERKSDGYFWLRKVLWGVILAVQDILFILGENVVHFLFN